jgi:hypothetical protein
VSLRNGQVSQTCFSLAGKHLKIYLVRKYFPLVPVKVEVYRITCLESRDGSIDATVFFLKTSTLDGVGGQRQHPAALPSVKRPWTHCTRGCVGPWTGLDGGGKSGVT